MTLSAGRRSGVAAVARADWDRLHPGAVEGWDYLVACEAAAGAVETAAAVVMAADGRVVAAAPLFALAYRLDMPLQGRLRRVGDAVARLAPGLVTLRLLGIGSPYADGLHFGLAPELSDVERQEAVRLLLAAAHEEAAARSAAVVVVKDLEAADAREFAAPLAGGGFAATRSLPLARLDLGGGDEAGYLARLSAATRKDVRRKLKAPGVAVEWRTGAEGVPPEVAALYERTRSTSEVRYEGFDALPDGYFTRVAAALGDRCRLVLYRVDGRIVAFNLLLLEADRAIDKFLGMAYPEGPAHDVYVRSWMENVRFCLATGRRFLQTGQTAYREKRRLGSTLEPLSLHVRHRNRVLNRMVRLAAPLIALDRWDPDLGGAAKAA